MDVCVCPAPAALTTIPKDDCKENIGQIQKWLFRRYPGAVFAAGAVKLIANWTPLFVAANSTKVVVSPFLPNTVIGKPEPVTIGGNDNTTIDGAVVVVGEGPAEVTGMVRSAKGAIIKAMKQLSCETLEAMFINEFDQMGLDSTDAGVTATFFKIDAFYIGSADNKGKNTFDEADYRFSLHANWRDRLALVTATDFSPKKDLVIP